MQEKKADSGLVNEVQLYLQSISAQDSLLQSYRILFIAMETILFALAFALHRNQNGLLLLPIICGLVFGVLWVIICNHRGWMIDKLKAETEQLVKCTNLESWFKLAYKARGEKWVPRFAFNMLSPALAIGLWIWLWVIWV